MRRWARRLPRPVDSYLKGVSEAASYSRLWLAAAVVMAVGAGERGRRAAGDGVLAIGVTSALVNGPLKLVFRRQRPPLRRRLRRYPKTSSFPSGHAASAFAFATAATRALPEAGGALFPLAASVAYSRVYLGVHYPTDVVAGAAVGATIGTAAGPVARTLRATAPKRSRDRGRWRGADSTGPLRRVAQPRRRRRPSSRAQRGTRNHPRPKEQDPCLTQP
jgi:membrane-associated phospholipid phosphatase